MQQLETNLNFISTLPDDPAMTTNALKQEFDKAGNVIKDFINNILEEEIESEIASCLADAKLYADSAIGEISFTGSNISYDNSLSGLEADNVQDAIDEIKSTTDLIQTNADSKLKYNDFAVTNNSVNVSLQKEEAKNVTLSASKSGYYPLGIVGHNNTNPAFIGASRYQITARNSGSCTITIRVSNSDWINARAGTLTYDILWAKIS